MSPVPADTKTVIRQWIRGKQGTRLVFHETSCSPPISSAFENFPKWETGPAITRDVHLPPIAGPQAVFLITLEKCPEKWGGGLLCTGQAAKWPPPNYGMCRSNLALVWRSWWYHPPFVWKAHMNPVMLPWYSQHCVFILNTNLTDLRGSQIIVQCLIQT